MNSHIIHYRRQLYRVDMNIILIKGTAKKKLIIMNVRFLPSLFLSPFKKKRGSKMKRDSTVLSDFLILRSFLKEKYLTIIQRKDITHNS